MQERDAITGEILEDPGIPDLSAPISADEFTKNLAYFNERRLALCAIPDDMLVPAEETSGRAIIERHEQAQRRPDIVYCRGCGQTQAWSTWCPRCQAHSDY